MDGAFLGIAPSATSSPPPSLLLTQQRIFAANVEAPSLLAQEGSASCAERDRNTSSKGEPMILIPEGSFTMGSREDDSEAYGDERPAHRVTLTKSFYIKATPVTQAEWETVMGFNPSYFKGAERPVEKVSWYDAVAYCNALSEREGLQPAYRLEGVQGKPGEKNYKIDEVVWERESPGYRLPTEAEWEYACRAGTTTPLYGDLDRIAWYCNNCPTTMTQPVGQKQPNAWGLYDMLGNVWEWVYDAWKRDYATSPVVDPVYEAGSFRVLRGGSWYYKARFCRSAFRFFNLPVFRSGALGFHLGFRVVRTAPSPRAVERWQAEGEEGLW